ncbi:MAG: NAD-dependent epimerase/dehydratase family protein [Actinomycetota bacterium]|nr:NAD-dependent epimerase/dehydratase family protein [Actinomycetota bacterium]
MSDLPAAPVPGTHLVVGAGEVGSAVARLLADAGADVVVASRRGRGPAHPLIRTVTVDASSVDALLSVVPDAVVIYNCVNPAYHRWSVDWPPMATAFLAYAERTGAVLATVSNLYGYGPVDVPMVENLPLAATSPKARIRVRMWQDAKAAHDAGRIRATEVRGSDYACAGDQSMLGDRVVPRVLAGKPVQLVGDVDQPHAWTSPVDTARLLITVAADPRGWGRAWHVPSNPPRSQRQAVEDLAAAAGVPPVKVSSVPAALMWGLGLVNPLIRELKETGYQRTRPYLLDDTAARTTFGLMPTPWDAVLRGIVAVYREPVLA